MMMKIISYFTLLKSQSKQHIQTLLRERFMTFECLKKRFVAQKVNHYQK